MSERASILAFAGSTRRYSYNKSLAAIAARGAEAAGARVTLIDLADYPLPIFDEDLEAAQGPPEAARRLKRLFLEHAGLLIASPEYNSSVTAVLKNAIDWVSRPDPDTSALAAFQGKAAGLMSASPGNLGGLRGLVHLRAILGNLGVLLLPQQVAVSRAFEAFDEVGALKDARRQAEVEGLGLALAELLERIRAT